MRRKKLGNLNATTKASRISAVKYRAISMSRRRPSIRLKPVPNAILAAEAISLETRFRRADSGVSAKFLGVLFTALAMLRAMLRALLVSTIGFYQGFFTSAAEVKNRLLAFVVGSMI